MSSGQGRYVARLFNTPPSHGKQRGIGDKNSEEDYGKYAIELDVPERKGSLAETDSIFRSPQASTLGTFLSAGRSEDLLGSSGTLTETKALRLGERQAFIEELLAIATPAAKKLKGLNALRNLIGSAEKSMSRSRSSYAIEVIDATPRLTDSGRELLLSTCQMLQSLIGQEDRALIQSDKVEVWMTEAASLYGRALAALFVTSPDHELSRPESLYLQVVQELLGHIQRDAGHLTCRDCSPSRPHAMNPTQLKLLIILSIFKSFWNHGKHYAETYIVDCLWPISQALHNCQEKLRALSGQLLSRILRTYSARQNRAVKGIEILAVTSYDAALQELLLQGGSSFCQQARPVSLNFLLETMIVLWKTPPQSLRYKMNAVRSDRYYDVPSLWNAIAPQLKCRGRCPSIEPLLCELLPLMAYWDPESFVAYLDPTLRFLTDFEPSPSAIPRLIALGKIVHALATEVLSMMPRIFQFLLAAIEANLKSDAAFTCAKMILQSLGPTATSEMAQVIASVERSPLRESSADFLTAIPLIIPSLTTSVNDYLLKEIPKIEQLGATVTTSSQWLALLKVLPRIAVGYNSSQLTVQRFLLSSLRPTAPTTIILEALKQCSDARLCTEETSSEIVNQVLILIAERQEPLILDASFQTISHHHLRFELKSVAHPLLLQLKRSDLQVQRIIVKLLTIQAIKFPSLIIPVLRNFTISTLVTLEKDRTKSQEWKLDSVAILGIVLPALPPALSKMYSRPILDYLLLRLKSYSTIGKGCKTCLEAIGNLARSCSHVWDVEMLFDALGQLQRLCSYASPKEAAGALACMASLMSIPESHSLQDGIMHYTFGHYLFSETTPESSVKIGVMSLIGSVGTADRNALSNRGQHAAMQREEGIYDANLRRRIATATVRDKRGVRSLDYKLSMISDNLVSALQRRGLPSKIPVWHIVMKLSLMLREEYVDKLPDVTLDIIEEIVEPSMSIGGRSYQPKLIALLSQSILLRNGTAYEDHIDRLLAVLQRIVADPEVRPNTLWSVLLVNLSIISRRKKDLRSSSLELLPLIHETSMKAAYLDKDTLVFGLKLIAAFQSHCTMFIGNIGELLDHVARCPYAEDEALLTEVTQCIAHLVDWTSLFEITAPVEVILRLVEMHVSARQGIDVMVAKIRSGITFCPIFPQQKGPSIYPDFRDYTDAQFINLALQPQERAQAEYDVSLWLFEDNIDYHEWQQWQSRMEYNILAACQIDVFFVVCALWSDIPRGILHVAFVNLWDMMVAEQKSAVETGITRLLRTPSTPQSIKSTWLSMMQFLHKCSLSQVTPKLLTAIRDSLKFDQGNINERCDPLVLWYAEIDSTEQFRAEKPIDFPKLIEANIRVGVGSNINQHDAAVSSVELAFDTNGLMPNSDWLVALGKWDEALIASAREFEKGETDVFNSVANQTICHFARLDYGRVYALANEHYDQFSNTQKARIAHWNTVASWAMGDFIKMSNYLTHFRKGSSKLMYKAVLEIHHGEHSNALRLLSKAKAAVYDELRVRTGYHDFSANNYTSAMKTLAKSEMLCELEEVIRYKEFAHRPEIQLQYRNAWESRLRRAHPNINSFYKRMLVWSLAAKPVELRGGWLHLAKLCQEQKVAAGKSLLDILDVDDQPNTKTEYTRMRFEWADTDSGNPARLKILQRLRQQTIALSQSCGFPKGVIAHADTWELPCPGVTKGGTDLQRRWLSRHLMRLGAWTREWQGESWLEDETLEVYKYTTTAVMIDSGWYSALDQLSAFALDVLDHRNLGHGEEPIPENVVEIFVLPACYAMFQSITLQHSAERTLKQTLQIITLWFRYGSNSKVVHALRQYLKRSPHKAWLGVLPQLIARLGAKDQRLRTSLLEFLLEVAKSFPHAVIWPLLTAAETPRSIHQTAAKEIMSKMRDDDQISRMVQEAQLVGSELNRTALSFAERWKTAIEKILYVDGLTPYTWAEVLDEYAILESPQSEEEYLFVQKYGDGLMSAKLEVERYLQGVKASYYKACGEYQALYRKIYGNLEEWRKSSFQLNLNLVAPRLITIEDSNLIVPGQYDASMPLLDQPYITRIDPTVDVINTKQLPRKLVMRSHREKFVFLLKGNEDLRQDERVMQLITLTNLLLSHNTDAFNRQLFIQPYSAIPLGPDSGLLSWIPNTETIMQLISSSRSKLKGDRTSENERAAMVGLDAKTIRQSHIDFDKLMQQYSALPMEQKLRQYRNALAQSDNDDLKNLLWRRSSSSQTWLSRRTCFARSIATTSMIGYVIGLGDRHPGNTLIEQTKFNAISIDFGDVFEAAHERTPYPEKVPFRLTPQIFNTFEFAAIHGNGPPGSRGHFKASSVLTMGIMRKHKASLLAMLEAFAYDPLLNWKAKEIEIQGKRRDEKPEQEASSVGEALPAEEKPVIRQEQLKAKTDKQRLNNLTISLGGSFIVAGSVMHPPVAEVASLACIAEEENEASSDMSGFVPSDTDEAQTDVKKPEESHGLDNNSAEDAGKKKTDTLAVDSGRRASQSESAGSKNHSDGYFAKMANTMTNDRALKVLTVIERKLQGRDVEGEFQSTEDQVQRLIQEATSHENLAQGYVLGWMPYW